MAALPGEKATAMVANLQKAQWLPPYDERLKVVLDEVDHLWKKNEELLSQNTDVNENGKRTLAFADEDARLEFIGSMTTYLSTIEHNKRCCLAYTNARVEKAKALFWASGTIIPEDKKVNLAKSEQDYFGKYCKSMAEYMQDSGLNLTAHMHPPKQLYCDVLVKEDVGTIVTADGVGLNLKPNSMHRTKFTDVEHLARQGAVEVKS